MARRPQPVPTPDLDAIFNPPPARRDPDPTRTTPNGFCIDCGVKLAKYGALRCRTHASLARTLPWRDTFTTESASRAWKAREERRKRNREELARYREAFEKKLEALRREGEARSAAARERYYDSKFSKKQAK